VLSEKTAKDNGIQPGDQVTLDLGDQGDDLWRVVGLYRILSIRPAPENIYASREAILRVTSRSDHANMLLVQMTAGDPATVTAITESLESLFERQKWNIIDTTTMVESRQFFDSFFAQYIPMLLVLAVITAVVGGIGLMGALSIAVVERTRELGVLRAIGATTPDLLRMLILEGVAQGLISWVAAVPLSFVLGRRVAALMGQALFKVDLDYQYNAWAVLIWLAAVLLIAVLASLLPARSATRVSVRASLAYA
jgi:putative ABC transport system permease protein